MKYTKVVSSTTEYNTFVNSANYYTPNVTYIQGNNQVQYGPKPIPLTFKALTAGSTIRLTVSGSPDLVSLSTSTDGGTTWTSYAIGNTITLTNVGDKVMFKATTTNSTFSGSENYYYFTMMGSIAASGDVTSLLNGTGGDAALSSNCFNLLFYGCTSLTTAPALPATTLANYCYGSMFQGCTSLTTTPALPATTLADYCYSSMFSGCTALTTAPVLPAATLAEGCYYGMFYNCTSLTTAPVLPATTLADLCYWSMFQGCTNLNYIKAMFTTTPSTSYTSNWVNGVSASGTFVKNSAANWNVTGVNGVPSGWAVETASA